jgi:hypothetical protein
MKGFYFSLDALTASMVLLATVAMIMSYAPPKEEQKKPMQLDNLHTASMQQISDWNRSMESDRSALEYIYRLYYEDSPSAAEDLCGKYFNLSKPYAVYVSNSTYRQKMCGGDLVSQSDSLAVSETVMPDIQVNSDFRGPYKAVMVMKN